MTRRLKKFIGLFLPALMLMTIMAGTAPAALLDFGPNTPEVVGSTQPNISTGFPAWFRDTNRVPLQLCLEEVPGCLFAQADAPNPGQQISFPTNIPDELFYYSATALIGEQLLFAGVEMNFADNGDGTYEQVGFARVRIRIDSTVAGNYTITTPWKQYVFTVDQATITANAGRRVINATEDIGLGPDGNFTGILLGNVGPYGYSQGAPFVTAAGSFLGDNTPRPLVGTPNNIFRIEGPPGFTTVETNLFAVTGKIYNIAPIPTPLTVDKATYALDNSGLQVSVFATTQPVSNQVNTAAAFPLNYALTNAPSALQLTGTDIPGQNMTTNNPADGKFFSTSGLFAAPGTLPTTVRVANTSDIPEFSTVVPLVDEVVINSATYNPQTGNISISASSYDTVNNPSLQAFIAGTDVLLGTLSNGLLNVALPDTILSKTYNIPPFSVTVKSAKGGSATLQVTSFIALPQPVPNAIALAPAIVSPQLVGTAIQFVAAASGGSGTYEYEFNVRNPAGVWTVAQAYSTTASWNWDTTGLPLGSYTITVFARNAGSTAAVEVYKTVYIAVAAQPEPVATATLSPVQASPQPVGTTVQFNAGATGGTGSYEYEFNVRDTTNAWTVARAYSAIATWNWDTTGLPPGNYTVTVFARNIGSSAAVEAYMTVYYAIQ